MSTGQIKHTSKNCNTKTQQTKTAGNAVMFDFCLLIINCLGFASSHRCLSQRGWVLCVVQEEGLGHRCTIWGLFHTIGSTTGIYRQKKGEIIPTFHLSWYHLKRHTSWAKQLAQWEQRLQLYLKLHVIN